MDYVTPREFRWHTALAILLTAIGSGRIVSTYGVLNHTIDEPAHLAAGLQWLSSGTYQYEDQHPPLARISGALGPYLSGERCSSDPNIWYEGFRILGRDRHYGITLALGRLGILPFFWIGSAVVFLWARRIAGGLAAVLSVSFFTTLPPILGHGGLITTDMALASLTASAALASLVWIKRPTVVSTLVLGVTVGLAVVSKFSALVFLPAAWMAMLIWHCSRERCRWRDLLARSTPLVLPAFAALGIAAGLVWSTYRFTFGRVEFLGCSLPAPAFWTGMQSVWKHNLEGHGSYLLGKLSLSGFWHYYPVLLAVKTPLPMIILLLWAAVKRVRGHVAMGLEMPIAFALGILTVALFSRINLGVRHILPVYIGACISCGVAASVFFQDPSRKRKLTKAVVAGLLLWHAATTTAIHPDYLAYTNEIAGSEPEKIVVDSDLDWGQDMKRLGERLARDGAKEVHFHLFNRGYLLAGYDFPTVLPLDFVRPSPGWNAVSVTAWKFTGNPVWANTIKPHERIGRSILLWHFDPNSTPPLD